MYYYWQVTRYIANLYMTCSHCPNHLHCVCSTTLCSQGTSNCKASTVQLRSPSEPPPFHWPRGTKNCTAADGEHIRIIVMISTIGQVLNFDGCCPSSVETTPTLDQTIWHDLTPIVYGADVSTSVERKHTLELDWKWLLSQDFWGP